MNVWAIGDIHLSGANPKPMEIFGDNWKHHDDKIAAAWRNAVADDDLVVVVGDTSWAIKLEEALLDLEWLAQLPGRKVLIRGNHDFWWSSLSKMRRIVPTGIDFIQNSAMRINNVVIAGSRGWTLPPELFQKYTANGEDMNKEKYDSNLEESSCANLESQGSVPHIGEFVAEKDLQEWTEQDEKILARELSRLTLSLDAAQRLADANCMLVVAVHYPPIYRGLRESPFTQLIKQYEPQIVVYGHLHGMNHSKRFEGQRGATRYHLVRADYLDFRPLCTFPYRVKYS